MGYRLYRHVLDHAPAELSVAERFILAVVADDANDTTRKGWPPVELVAHRTGMTALTVRKMMQRLRRRGYDIRVPLKVGTDGRPVYAWRGMSTTYQVPLFELRDVPVRKPVDNSTERVEQLSTLSPRKGGTEREKGWNEETERVDRDSTPSPQHPLKSPQQQHGGVVAIVTEATGVSPEHAAAAIELIRCEKNPDNLGGFVRHLARANELGEWLDMAANGSRPLRGTDRKVMQALELGAKLEAAEVVDGEVVDEPCPHGSPGARYCALCRRGIPAIEEEP